VGLANPPFLESMDARGHWSGRFPNEQGDLIVGPDRIQDKTEGQK